MELPVLKKLIDKFQCPGCSLGCRTDDCSSVKIENTGDSRRCTSHSPGTMMIPGGLISLGLPTGFNKGIHPALITFLEPEQLKSQFNFLNIPVWAMEENIDGSDYLFIRVYSPRTNKGRVMVVPNGRFSDIPLEWNVWNVKKFINEID